MGKGSFERATWYYILGWFPIYFITGFIVHLLGWDKTFPLLYLVIAAVIFLIFVVPIVVHLEKKSKEKIDLDLEDLTVLSYELKKGKNLKKSKK